MAQLLNITLNNNRAVIRLDRAEDIYSTSLISESIDNGIDGRVRYRQEVKGNIQQLHERVSITEAG